MKWSPLASCQINIIYYPSLVAELRLNQGTKFFHIIELEAYYLICYTDIYREDLHKISTLRLPTPRKTIIVSNPSLMLITWIFLKILLKYVCNPIMNSLNQSFT